MYTNPSARSWTCKPAPRDVREFHAELPRYHPSPLIEIAPRVFVKDESDRFGLPAFKILGASWAVNRAIGPARTFRELADLVAGRSLTLLTATDGNHGRALAYVARLLGLQARIYVPTGLPDSTVQAIRNEGAEVIDTGGAYDDAVRIAAASCTAEDVLIQDTAWHGYEEVPRWIVGGYLTLFEEIDAELGDDPGLVVVPTGVGSLLQSAIEHYRAPGRSRRTAILAVEPVTAACVTASLQAGKPVSVDASVPTIMAGLNCGTVSSTAWPAIQHGLDASIAVTDAEARAALETLRSHGLLVGPCGAAALAGAQAARDLGPATSVVLISTEGIEANRT